ncbi:MAG: TetR/AcrR family transcriptional regulator [Proteobacteria bacterium]|nr:TetR/AcrR family transcriptional regulator [Pseudomonadota bacterium]
MKTERMDTRARQDQIVEAALAIVGAQGVRAMTIERVARLVGLAPSALYRHFASKADLLMAVLNRISGEFSQALDKARTEPDALSALHGLLMGLIRNVLEHQSIPRILFSDEIDHAFPKQKERLLFTIRFFLENLAEIIRSGQGNGIIRPELDPVDIALAFVGTFQSTALMYHLNNGRFDMIHQADKNFRLFCLAVENEHSQKKDRRPHEMA